ncbi:MAG: sigma-70 family RNA polymerase sigma factor [Planctomycetaceae bacterium]|nr:sigma-70 family RNA polymerase sigma factor [Planctomycetaceae bacterium]
MIETDTFDETALVAQLQRGDAEAFETLVRQHGGRMLAVARRMLGDEHAAQDAVQDAFLAAFRALGEFGGQSQLSTWLHRIVVNASLMKLRTRKRKPECSLESLLPRFLEDGHQAEPATPWTVSAETACESEEIRRLVRECIDSLPEIFRTVLVLRDLEQVPTEEAARLLDVTESVVKTRLHRARLALRGLIDRRLQGASPC